MTCKHETGAFRIIAAHCNFNVLAVITFCNFKTFTKVCTRHKVIVYWISIFMKHLGYWSKVLLLCSKTFRCLHQGISVSCSSLEVYFLPLCNFFHTIHLVIVVSPSSQMSCGCWIALGSSSALASLFHCLKCIC